jgi:hypothetical protein
MLSGALVARAGEGHFGAPQSAISAAPPAASAADSAPLPSDLKLSAQPAGPDGAAPGQVTVSPDGQHIAYTTHQGSRIIAVIDSKSGPVFDSIESVGSPSKLFTFSSDGTRCAYLGRSGDERKVMVNDQQGAGGAQIRDFLFSPDGAHYAYSTISGNGQPWFEVFDGKPQAQACVSEPKNPVFSADNQHFAYVATVKFTPQQYGDVVVMDGQPQQSFGKIREFAFSADGKHYAYIGDDAAYVASNPDAKAHLIFDGKERAAYPAIFHITLSADGAHLAAITGKPDVRIYTARLDDQNWEFAFDSSELAPLVLSPDGTKVAYMQYKGGGRKSVIVNGKKGLDYDDLHGICFSGDNHLYYTATMLNGGGQGSGPTSFIVRDEQEFGPYPATPNGGTMPYAIAFSPDGKHAAYRAGDGKNVFIVRDGKKSADFNMLLGPLVFSPDSQHLAFLATRGVNLNMSPIQRQQYLQTPGHDTGNYLIVDDKTIMLPEQTIQSAMSLEFSPDSQHTLFRPGASLPLVDGQSIGAAVKPGSYTNVSITQATFSPDSKHLIYSGVQAMNPGSNVVVDGELIPAYHPVAPAAVRSDGKLFFFAQKAPTVMPFGVTVDMGPPRNFGIGAGGGATNIATNQPAQQPTQSQQQQQANQQQTNQQQANQQQTNQQQANPQQASQQQPSEQTPEQSVANQARQRVKRAKQVGDGLKGLFGHHP